MVSKFCDCLILYDCLDIWISCAQHIVIWPSVGLLLTEIVIFIDNGGIAAWWMSCQTVMVSTQEGETSPHKATFKLSVSKHRHRNCHVTGFAKFYIIIWLPFTSFIYCNTVECLQSQWSILRHCVIVADCISVWIFVSSYAAVDMNTVSMRNILRCQALLSHKLLRPTCCNFRRHTHTSFSGPPPTEAGVTDYKPLRSSWDDQTPEQHVPKETDLAIIGGGLVGLCTAFFIKHRFPRSFNIVIIEKDPLVRYL